MVNSNEESLNEEIREKSDNITDINNTSTYEGVGEASMKSGNKNRLSPIAKSGLLGSLLVGGALTKASGETTSNTETGSSGNKNNIHYEEPTETAKERMILMYKLFKEAGLPHNAIMGILGNLGVESGDYFNPAALNNSEYIKYGISYAGEGLHQMTYGTKLGFAKWYNEHYGGKNGHPEIRYESEKTRFPGQWLTGFKYKPDTPICIKDVPLEIQVEYMIHNLKNTDHISTIDGKQVKKSIFDWFLTEGIDVDEATSITAVWEAGGGTKRWTQSDLDRNKKRVQSEP